VSGTSDLAPKILAPHKSAVDVIEAALHPALLIGKAGRTRSANIKKFANFQKFSAVRF
jgi:hypothetical protein